MCSCMARCDPLVLPAVFDDLMNVELKGSQQDAVQGFWGTPQVQEHGQARLQSAHIHT